MLNQICESMTVKLAQLKDKGGGPESRLDIAKRVV